MDRFCRFVCWIQILLGSNEGISFEVYVRLLLGVCFLILRFGIVILTLSVMRWLMVAGSGWGIRKWKWEEKKAESRFEIQLFPFNLFYFLWYFLFVFLGRSLFIVALRRETLMVFRTVLWGGCFLKVLEPVDWKGLEYFSWQSFKSRLQCFAEEFVLQNNRFLW